MSNPAQANYSKLEKNSQKVDDLNDKYIKVEHKLHELQSTLQNLEAELHELNPLFESLNQILGDVQGTLQNSKPGVFKRKFTAIKNLMQNIERNVRHSPAEFSDLYTLIKSARENLSTEIIPVVFLEQLESQIKTKLISQERKRQQALSEKSKHKIIINLLRSGNLIHAVPTRTSAIVREYKPAEQHALKSKPLKIRLKLEDKKYDLSAVPLPGFTGAEKPPEKLVILKDKPDYRAVLCHEVLPYWKVNLQEFIRLLKWQPDAYGELKGTLKYQGKLLHLHDVFNHCQTKIKET